MRAWVRNESDRVSNGRYYNNKMKVRDVQLFPRIAGSILAVMFAGAAASAQTQPPANDAVVRITSDLIQLDVVATDRSGKPVLDLRPEEIEIYENGKKQKLSGMTLIAGSRDTVERQPERIAGVAPPPVPVRASSVRRTIALVVDDITLSFESAHYTRLALKRYVDEQMQPGDLVAIIRTGAGIGALQQFTSDKRILYAAIDRVRWNPIGGGGISAFEPVSPTPLQIRRSTGDTTVSDEDLAEERNQIRGINDFRGSSFASGTLGALRFIVNGMADLPGRKSVVLFSEGFRLTEIDPYGFAAISEILEFMRQVIDEANRRSIVFYTIDARGLQTVGITAADEIIDNSPQAINQILDDRRAALNETQDSLNYLAVETGGLAIRNTNDLSDGVRKVLEDQSYYLVAYEPDDDTFDPARRKFNRIEIRVSRPGVTARYRSGFFNVAERPRPSGDGIAASVPPERQLARALASPFAVSGITLRLNAVFGSEARSGSYVRSLLHVNAGDLTFVDDGKGGKKAAIEVMAASFGADGAVVDQLLKGYVITVNPAQLRAFTESGFIYSFVFPVKRPGAYQYRVAIRDQASGKLGSASQFIEVPDIKKDRLTLSGLVIETYSRDQWTRIQADPKQRTETGDPMTDTALRRVRQGRVLTYAAEVYNAKLAAGSTDLVARIRIFRDGKLVLDGNDKPVSAADDPVGHRLSASGAISIGAEMEPGDYVMQIVVTDRLAKTKQQIATQWVQFEVVE